MAITGNTESDFSTFHQVRRMGPKLGNIGQAHSPLKQFVQVQSQKDEDSFEMAEFSPQSGSPQSLATPGFTPSKFLLNSRGLQSHHSNHCAQFGKKPAVSPVLITSEHNLSSQNVNTEADRGKNSMLSPKGLGNSPGSFSGGLGSPALSADKQAQPSQDPPAVLNRYTSDIFRHKAYAWQSPPNSRQFSEIDVARFEAYQREAELQNTNKLQKQNTTTVQAENKSDQREVPHIFRQLYFTRKPAALNVSFNGTVRTTSKQVDDSRGFMSRRSLVTSQAEQQSLWREILTAVDSLMQKSFSWPSVLKGQNRFNIMSVIDTAVVRKRVDLLSSHLVLLVNAKQEIPRPDWDILDKLNALISQFDQHATSFNSANETTMIKNSAFSDLIGKVHRDTTILTQKASAKESEDALPKGKCLMYCDHQNGRTLYLSEKEVTIIKDCHKDMVQRAPEYIRRYLCSFEEYMELLLQHALHPCEAANHKDRTNSEAYAQALNAYKSERRSARK